MLVSAWNPSVMPDNSISFSENVANHKAALPPCHAFFQFYVAEENSHVNSIKGVQIYFWEFHLILPLMRF